MRIEPVPDVPALKMTGEKDRVCVADLHLGIEVQLRASGFSIPSQTRKMLESLVSLSEVARNLVVLGDVKHRIPSAGYHGSREIGPFLTKLQDHFEEIVIVAGNHDGGLSEVVPAGYRSVAGPGMRLEDVGLCHGHVWPSKDAMGGSKLVIGHVHPAVMFVDSLGTRSTEKCWLRATLDRGKVLERYDSCPEELVVVPSFNPLLTGTPVNAPGGVRLGPLFRNALVDESSYRAYLLDGANLGRPPTIAAKQRRKRAAYM